MWPVLLIFVYSLLIVGASLLGGWLPALVRLTHTWMQTTMSFVGGLMLGVALLHMLPHAAAELGSLRVAAAWLLLGLLIMFFMMRWFHFHQHDPQQELPAHEEHEHVEQEQPCDEPHEHLISHLYHSDQPHQLSWLGLFFGLAVHTVIDGVALAASVAAGMHGENVLGLVGLGTFLAVLLHKPLDAFSITSVMVAAGWTRGWIGLVNLLFALMCPVGALCFYFGVQGHALIGASLGGAAGVFLCISLADLLPEVQFHRHDRVKLTGALVLGVLLAVFIGFFEPEHTHPSPAPHAHEDGHHEHGEH